MKGWATSFVLRAAVGGVKMSKTVLPRDFMISSEMRDWATKKFPTIDVDEATEEFCDYWRGHGKMMADWVATWRNWIRRVPQFSRPVQRVTKTSIIARRSEPIAPPANLNDNSPRFPRKH
jgi:hypothetical protein